MTSKIKENENLDTWLKSVARRLEAEVLKDHGIDIHIKCTVKRKPKIAATGL
jgi:hypothetical protein